MKPFYTMGMVYSLWIAMIYSYSLCDDVDIHFIIDSDSIIHNQQSIQRFIQSIVWNGTSEYSAVSVAIYGEIPALMESNVVIKLKEIHDIYQPLAQEKYIMSKLAPVFNYYKAMIPSSSSSLETTSITLGEAYERTKGEFKARRVSKKKVKQAIDADDEYFVFDYDNKLLAESGEAVCPLLGDIHFMMGQEIEPDDIQCDKGDHGGESKAFFSWNTANKKQGILIFPFHKK